jgi:hypothetical protein
MEFLGATKFDRAVIDLALINLCNQESKVGKEMRQRYCDRQEATAEAVINPWFDLHWFTICVPHPDQQYENLPLEAILTQGDNIEIKPVEDSGKVPYQIPAGGHFVVILKQKRRDAKFEVAATGIFVRPLAVLSLDVITDAEKPEYQPLIVKHPIVREYPAGWEQKLKAFIQREVSSEDLPNLVAYVDQASNQDYRSPTWNEVHRSAQGILHL